VETAVSLPLEPGLVQDGVVINPAVVGRLIGELMAANGISEKRAVIGISGVHSIYRVVSIPKLPKNLLDEAAQREAERAMPVPLNELYLSWQTISTSDIEMVICLVGMPRSTVDAMLDTLHQAGLQPEAMDIRSLALARVTDERDAIIINVQPSGFDIVIMTDGIPELLRSLPFPADAISPDEKVAEVKEEMERTVTFYNSSHKGNEITSNTAAFVSGELGDMMAATLEYRAKPLPRLLSYSDNLNANEYTANIGLALRQARADASPARVSMNVTPEAYMPKPFPLIQLVSWAFILVAAAILIMFGTLTLQKYRDNISLQAQIIRIQTQIQARQGTQSAITQLQTKINQAKQDAAIFKQPVDATAAQRAKVNSDLSTVTSLLPGIIEARSIGYNNEVTTITGIAPADTTIVDYVRALRNSGQFSEVLISDMREVEYNEWQFTLTLK
jgi:type IV pilus assembly protein PilM